MIEQKIDSARQVGKHELGFNEDLEQLKKLGNTEQASNQANANNIAFSVEPHTAASKPFIQSQKRKGVEDKEREQLLCVSLLQ